MWTSISNARKNFRVSRINAYAEALEALPPETLGMQMQVTASRTTENHPSLTGWEGWEAGV